MALLTLFDCSLPTNVKVAPSRLPKWSRFAENSWTRFSPKVRIPAWNAATIFSAGWVLLTAIKVMSAGLRPARRAAAAMRSRTPVTFSAIALIAVILQLWWNLEVNLMGLHAQQGAHFL